MIYLERTDDVVWIESTSRCRDLVAVAGRNPLALCRFGTSVEKLWELKTKELWNIVKEMLGEDADCVVLHHVLLRNDAVIAVGTYASECLCPLLLEVSSDGKVLKALEFQHPNHESDDAYFVCMDLDAEGMYVAIADYLRSRIAVRSADGFKELAETTVRRYPTSLTWIGRNVLAVGKAGGYVELYRFDGRYLKLLEEQKVARDTISWSHGLSYSSRNWLLAVGSRDRHVYALACPRESSIEAIEQGVDSRGDRHGSRHDLKQVIEVLKRSSENVESTLAPIWETS